jgi:copper transport protein
MRLWFSEAVSTKFRSVTLLQSNGRIVPVRLLPARAGNEIAFSVPHLPRGAYGVVWHVLAEDDGHTTNGTLSFGVGVAAAQHAQRSSPAPPTFDVMLRWLRFVLTAALLGGLAFVVLVLPHSRPRLAASVVERTARRALGTAVVGGSGVLLVGLVVLARQTDAVAAAGNTSWAAALRDLTAGSRWGALWLAGEAILAGLLVLALSLRGRVPAVPAPAAAVASLLATALVGVNALGSHAAALPHSRIPVIVDAAHVFAATIWTGALLALVVALLPVGGLRVAHAHAVAIALRRPFALVAGGSMLLLVVTGLYIAGVQVTSVDALLTTLYGRTLVAKSLLVAICCCLGGLNYLALRSLDRRRVARRFRVILGVEAVAGAGVLLAAAVLSASVPAHGPKFSPPRAVHARTLAASVSDVVFSVTVQPNRPGVNFVTVAASSSRRPTPTIDAVSAGTSPLRKVGDRWTGTVELASPGDVSLPIRIRRTGVELSARVGWRVEPGDPALAVRYSSRSLASLVDPAALALIALVAAGLAGALLLRLPLPRLPREEHA